MLCMHSIFTVIILLSLQAAVVNLDVFFINVSFGPCPSE